MDKEIRNKVNNFKDLPLEEQQELKYYLPTVNIRDILSTSDKSIDFKVGDVMVTFGDNGEEIRSLVVDDNYKPRNVRQAIIIRKDLKMRRGKEIAQGSHASSAFMSRRLREYGYIKMDELSPEIQQWLNGGVAKICLKVDSEDEIKKIFEGAKEAGLETHIIVDSGKTEFNGVPTITALSIGPNYKEDIDPFTKQLKLY